MDFTPNDPASPPPPQYQTIPPPGPPPLAASGLSDNAAGALAYVTFIPAVIFLVTEPYSKNPFIRFHAMQSIGLFAVWVACFIVQTVILVIPILGFLISCLIGLTLFLTWCFTVFKASQGEWFKLPLLGDFAMSKSKA
jgi:uncharacterized membrane protein